MLQQPVTADDSTDQFEEALAGVRLCALHVPDPAALVEQLQSFMLTSIQLDQRADAHRDRLLAGNEGRLLAHVRQVLIITYAVL